jgi:hypothetical protein
MHPAQGNQSYLPIKSLLNKSSSSICTNQGKTQVIGNNILISQLFEVVGT